MEPPSKDTASLITGTSSLLSPRTCSCNKPLNLTTSLNPLVSGLETFNCIYI